MIKHATCAGLPPRLLPFQVRLRWMAGSGVMARSGRPRSLGYHDFGRGIQPNMLTCAAAGRYQTSCSNVGSTRSADSWHFTQAGRYPGGHGRHLRVGTNVINGCAASVDHRSAACVKQCWCGQSAATIALGGLFVVTNFDWCVT